MRLAYDGQAVPLLVESDAFEGVKRIAGKLAEDICKVTGCKPQILPEGQLSAEQAGAVLCATMGKSPLLEALEQAGICLPAAAAKGPLTFPGKAGNSVPIRKKATMQNIKVI